MCRFSDVSCVGGNVHVEWDEADVYGETRGVLPVEDP